MGKRTRNDSDIIGSHTLETPMCLLALYYVYMALNLVLVFTVRLLQFLEFIDLLSFGTSSA
jgi:hypothetical protein